MLKCPIEDSFTFDNVLLLPGYSKVPPGEVTVKSNITQTLECNLPLLSVITNMVKKYQTAICMSKEWGIGIINKNKNVEEQASQVNVVKRSENGMIFDPNYR